MDMWNKSLTRENIQEFYESTIFMAYSSVLNITKETTRAEQAIIKSYTDVYQKRSVLAAEDVIYVFGDILLGNTNEIVEKSPPPENIDFSGRSLDEYTKNYMLEKILNKIESKGYKITEFISSDYKKSKGNRSLPRIFDLLPVTPLLFFQLIIVAIIIWVVSYAAVTIPYRNDPLVNSNSVYTSYGASSTGDSEIHGLFGNLMPFFPLNINYPVQEEQLIDVPVAQPNEEATTEPDSSVIAPVIATTTTAEPVATMG